MPTQPDNNADELLRAYAAKRLSEADLPLQMDQTTRNRLLAEAEKLHPPSPAPAEPRFTWGSLFWPRFAAAGSFVALVVALLVWLQPASDRPKADHSESESPSVSQLPDIPQPEPIGARALSEAVTTTEALAEPQKQASVSQMPAADARTASVASEQQPTLSRWYFSRAAGDSARFRSNFNSPPPLPDILVSFEVQQTGNHLRIIDADGSVYAGELLASSGSAQDMDRKVGLALSYIGFTAGGTNRTIDDYLVLTGRLAIATAPRLVPPGTTAAPVQPRTISAPNRDTNSQLAYDKPMEGQFKSAVKLGEAVTSPRTESLTIKSADGPSAPELIHRVFLIEGKALVNNGQEISIQATPVDRNE